MPTNPDLPHRLKERLLALPPRAFELFGSDLLACMGLRNIAITRYGGDGGIDAVGTLESGAGLVSVEAGVQMKRHRANVQRPDIDRFIGALSNRYAQGIFITTAGYARQAAAKAAASIPRVATVNGEQVAALMLRDGLGVTGDAGAALELDEEYFAQFEALAGVRPGKINDKREPYVVSGAADGAPRPEDDLISMRALSHALRVDASVIRRWVEQGRLQPDQPGLAGRASHFFRRDRIEAIGAELLGRSRPATPEAWRQEFLAFARSKTMSKSYKPVLLKALLAIVDSAGEARLDAVAAEFRAFYIGRRLAGLPVEHGPPDVSDPAIVSDAQLRQLIVRNPLERFLIKGFLEYAPAEGVVRFAPQLWAELRYRELLEVLAGADEQLRYYYSRLG